MALKLDYDQEDDEIVPVVIRMPVSLHRALKEKAASDDRPMAQAIRFAVRKYVDDRD
jgi:hypothetical protein